MSTRGCDCEPPHLHSADHQLGTASAHISRRSSQADRAWGVGTIYIIYSTTRERLIKRRCCMRASQEQCSCTLYSVGCSCACMHDVWRLDELASAMATRRRPPMEVLGPDVAVAHVVCLRLARSYRPTMHARTAAPGTQCPGDNIGR